jgi:hypothetical protein
VNRKAPRAAGVRVRLHARRAREFGTLIYLRPSSVPTDHAGDADMTNPKPLLDQDDEADLPDDLLESIEDTAGDEDDFGDETQSDDELETEEGLGQDHFIREKGDNG